MRENAKRQLPNLVAGVRGGTIKRKDFDQSVDTYVKLGYLEPGEAEAARASLDELTMRISVAADERVGVAEAVLEELRERGHEPIPHGALSDDERDDWAWASEAAARDVAEGRAEQAIVCCWTGHRRLDRGQQGARDPRRALPRRADRRGRAEAGTTPTRWRSACARPPRPSWARSSTPGSPASPAPRPTTAPTSSTSARSSER